MGQMEINPKELFNELSAMREKERNRQITEALKGRELTPVQRRQLEMELEGSTRFMDGELTATDSDGNPLHDDHGWPVSVQQHIRQTAKTLLGVEPQAPQQPLTPTNGEELFHAMKGAKTDAERQEIYKLYKGE